MAFKFPYTNFQMVNLDWIMKTLNKLKDAIPLVESATTVYQEALETLAEAEAAVNTVTSQAAEALSTAQEAATTATEANTTAATANSRAATAETNATAAQANALTAVSTAQAASTAAETAQTTANTALAKTTWTLKDTLRKHTNNDNTYTSFSVANISAVLIVLTCSTGFGGTLNRTIELPGNFITEDGTATPASQSGLPLSITNCYYIAASSEFVYDIINLNVLYDSTNNTIGITYVSDSILGTPEVYCRVYAR